MGTPNLEGLIPHSFHPSFSVETTHVPGLWAQSLKRMMPEENGQGTARRLIHP